VVYCGKTPEQARLIRTAREVNDAKPEWVIDQVKIKIADFYKQIPIRRFKMSSLMVCL
jgi:UDP-N-acetyl-D-mannosaminuronic acid dehydrogenase